MIPLRIGVWYKRGLRRPVTSGKVTLVSAKAAFREAAFGGSSPPRRRSS